MPREEKAKWFRYKNITEGEPIQAEGVDIPVQGLYSEKRLERLDPLVGIALSLEFVDEPEHKGDVPSLQVQNALSGKTDAVLAKEADDASTDPKPADESKMIYTDVQLRAMSRKDMQEVCRKHGIANNNFEQAFSGLVKAGLVKILEK